MPEHRAEPSDDPAQRRRATSADVARAAGVSRATVSYVLNGVPGKKISRETRELVLRTASELGHVPNAPARSLRLGRSDIVLVLVRDFALGFVASSLLHALDAALAERGHIILVDRYDSSLRSVSELWQLVSPALVVAMGGLSGGPPFLEQPAIELSSERFLSLQGTVPNVLVGELQAEYLAGQGHTVIGYALPSSPTAEIIASERLHGIRMRCAALGLPEPIVHVVDADDPETVRRALDLWLAQPGLTAVAAHSDDIALLICAWLSARGLKAGTDLAVMGVDDIPAARIELTTIGIDVHRWATQVVAAVEAMLDDRQPEPISSDILNLIVRGTA